MRRGASFLPFPAVGAALAAGLVALGVARPAHALGPLTVEVGGKVGVGTNPTSGPNPFGFGIGARGGVQIFGLYAGLSVMHYFGGGQDVPNGIGNSTTKVSASSTLFGAELGYGISVGGLLTIRPQVGIGSASFSYAEDSSATQVQPSGDGSHLYLEPGLTVVVPLGLFFVGADVSALILPGVDQGDGTSKTDASFTAHGQVGVHF